MRGKDNTNKQCLHHHPHVWAESCGRHACIADWEGKMAWQTSPSVSIATAPSVRSRRTLDGANRWRTHIDCPSDPGQNLLICRPLRCPIAQNTSTPSAITNFTLILAPKNGIAYLKLTGVVAEFSFETNSSRTGRPTRRATLTSFSLAPRTASIP